ncbi:MAG: ParM/StbA family protein, partial [Microcystaceae cyanobacterium]
MADLCLAFDPGSSLSKGIYTLKPFKMEWLVMEPEVVQVPYVGIEQYESNRIGNPHPENQAWIERQGNYYAVGFLARKRFYGRVALKEVKYRQAVDKVLAMVGAIASSKRLPREFSLSLGILLPFGEYEDRKRFKELMAEALENFSFRGQLYRVKLEQF